ncbi:MAG: MATE family efflux transporter [Pseudomonadota bacterium]
MRFTRHTIDELTRLAVPMVVSQGAFALMMFADRFFLSRIDATHVAASLGGGVSFWVCLCFFNGIAAYSNALVAQYLGRGEKSLCPQVVWQGVLLSILTQPMLLALGIFWADIFDWMGHSADQVALEKPFFQVYMAASIVFLIKTVLASYFSGIGRTKVVMIADVAGVVLNMPLSYVLIFGKLGLPELGIIGAAAGTIIAAAFSSLIYLAYFFERQHAQEFSVRDSFTISSSIMRRYVRLGTPSGLEIFIVLGTFNGFLLLYQSYGVTEGAAMAIVFNWDMLCFVPLMGLNIAIMSLVGRAVGAGEIGRAEEVIGAGYLLGGSYAATLAVLFVIFRYPLLDVFSVPGQDFSGIRAIGGPMMIGMASYVIADAVILVSSGVLRGAGDTVWLMKTSMVLGVLMLLVQVGVILVWKLGPLTSWFVLVATIIAKATLYGLRVRGDTWRAPERLESVMAE